MIANLLQNSTDYDTYPSIWTAQYGDGLLNEIYELQICGNFADHPFPVVSYYIYQELQVILFGVRTEHNNILLNPFRRKLRSSDHGIFIAPYNFDFGNLQKLSLDRFLEFSANMTSAFLSASYGSIERLSLNAKPLTRDDFCVGYPESEQRDKPECFLLKNAPKSLDEIIIQECDFSDHILVCTYGYNIFYFLCTLRSSRLSPAEFKKILFLCPTEPSDEDFLLLRQFPDIFVKIGDPRSKSALLACAIGNANKVVINNMHNAPQQEAKDGFSDLPGILTAHQIYGMFDHNKIRMTTIIDLRKLFLIRKSNKC